MRHLLLLPFAASVLGAQEPPPLVVHEWGTFTCLCGAAGEQIAGVNTEDEPLPPFVHRPVLERLGMFLLPDRDLAPGFFQGAPACHPDVTMRLETPVLYFHPAPDTPSFRVDVEVRWRGGWLSEFFPRGDVELPGIDAAPGGRLDADAHGALRWNGVQVGGEVGTPPATDAAVWLAPRNVAAADLRVGDEAERFLFYRGVGNVLSPFAVVEVAAGDRAEPRLALESRIPARIAKAGLGTGPAWLVDVDPVRGCAFRAIPPLSIPRDGRGRLAEIRSTFAAEDYAPAHADALRAAMHRALVADGLFADEAEALLATWRVSYFGSPGLRVFCLVPQAWTDDVMPLTLSVPARVTRVMVARIELIGPRQKAALATIAAGPTSDRRWFDDFTMAMAREDGAEFARVWGELNSRPGALLQVEGLHVPADYRAWLELGRFRQAIVLDALAHDPAPGLAAFASSYGID